MGLDVGELHRLDGMHAIPVGILFGGIAQLDDELELLGLANPGCDVNLGLSNRV
jgi:hypothetical protein